MTTQIGSCPCTFSPCLTTFFCPFLFFAFFSRRPSPSLLFQITVAIKSKSPSPPVILTFLTFDKDYRLKMDESPSKNPPLLPPSLSCELACPWPPRLLLKDYTRSLPGRTATSRAWAHPTLPLRSRWVLDVVIPSPTPKDPTEFCYMRLASLLAPVGVWGLTSCLVNRPSMISEYALL